MNIACAVLILGFEKSENSIVSEVTCYETSSEVARIVLHNLISCAVWKHYFHKKCIKKGKDFHFL